MPTASATTDPGSSFDMSAGENTWLLRLIRWAAVVEAIGDDWDPVEVLAQEDRAWAMLYSNLDENQQRIYDDLVAAGVLPDRVAGRVAD